MCDELTALDRKLMSNIFILTYDFSGKSHIFINTNYTRERGVTVIEMVVVVGIFLIFAGSLLSRSSDFHNSSLLSTVAYEVAITIRETQVIATSVSGIESGGNTTFDAPYGIYLDEANGDSYIQYADINEDGAYDSSTDEIRNEYTVGDLFTIQDVCTDTGSDVECFSDSSLSVVDIIYQRPSSSAIIYTTGGSGGTMRKVDIIIASDGGATSTVSVYKSGQIAVD